ncbi:MAG: UbiA-like polyprenyltransferase [Syntrophomonadaceae bacterium]|nr:UbiA-like polyprenyltransferase [Syntrophomonadaceae bacterium]
MAWTKIKVFFRMIDLEHSLFALPFAYMGALLAARGVPGGWELLWITTAMIGARTAALCLNRLIDRHIDRANPRTAHWAMASGQLSVFWVWVAVVICLAILLVSAYMLNPLCLKLAPLAVLALWGYSYTKRFTWWCHLLLGMAIGIGPVGGWIAITGSMDWRPLVLWLVVAFWVGGFDTMYACQDVEFDRSRGLYSVPARFGVAAALKISALLHFLVVVLLALSGAIFDLNGVYYAGTAFVAALLLYEHLLVGPGDLEQVNTASFRVNHYVGLILLAVTAAGVLWS